MISALARGYVVLDRQEYLDAALRAAHFIRRELFDSTQQRLFRSYRQGPSNILGFLDDYAYLIQALLDLYEASFDDSWLFWARDLQAIQDSLFWDSVSGAYFSVPEGHADVLIRLKEDHDGAEPSPNSTSALNLLRLSVLLSDQSYKLKADQTMIAMSERLAKTPSALPQMQLALILSHRPFAKIVIVPGIEEERNRQVVAKVERWSYPARVVLYARRDSAVLQADPALKSLRFDSPDALVQICENSTCHLPVSNLDQLDAVLASYPSF